MTEYDFALKFKLQAPEVNPGDYVEQLYVDGCDDVLIGVGKKGFISLNFIREASSAYEAISSAIADVKKVLPNATLVEAVPDFVGLTDAAQMLGCTRQNIRNLIVKSEGKATLPIYEGTPSLWHLAEILLWLRDDKTYAIDDALLEVAQTNMNINTARSWKKVESSLQDSIQTLLV
jgi:hypothetical protein